MADKKDKRGKGGGILGRLPTPKLPGQRDAGGSSQRPPAPGARPFGSTQPGGSRPGGISPPGQGQQRSGSKGGGLGGRLGIGGGKKSGGGSPGGGRKESGGLLGGRLGIGGGKSSTGPQGRPGGQQQAGRPFGGAAQPGGQKPGSRFGGSSPPGGQQQPSRPFGGSAQPGGQQPGGQQPSSRFGGGSPPGGQQQPSRPFGGAAQPGGQQPGGRLGSSSKLPPPGGRQAGVAQTPSAQVSAKERTRATTAARAKPRAAKKKQQDVMLSLDTRLDIIGIALVVAALITVLSFLSKDPGKFTGWWLTVIRQLFGWGAFVVPLLLGAIGVWLILRKFEDKLPDVEPVRLIGGAVAYVALLTGIHFFLLLFKPDCPAPPQITQLSYRLANCGHGGGYVGGFLYTTLHDLIGGGGVFVTFVAVGLVGSMIAAELTAKEAVELGVRGYHYLRKGGPATAFKRTKSGAMVPVQAEGEADKAKDKVAKPEAEKAQSKGEPVQATAQGTKAEEVKAEGGKPEEADRAKPAMPKLPGIGEKAPAGATAVAAAGSVEAAKSVPASEAAVMPRPGPARPAPSRPGPAGLPARPVAPGAPDQPPEKPAQPMPGPLGREFPQTVRPVRAVPKPGAVSPDEAESEAGAAAEAMAAPPVTPPPRPIAPPLRPGVVARPPVAPPPRPAMPPTRSEEAGASPDEGPKTEAGPLPQPPKVERVAGFKKDEEEMPAPGAMPSVATTVVASGLSKPSPAMIASDEATEPSDSKGAFPDEFSPPPVLSKIGHYSLPDFRELLKPGVEKTITDDELRRRAEIIENTLASFGAPGRVVEVNQGPVITQFGVEPDYIESRAGKRTKVKVGKISALADDIALALAAPTIRIEAPVPGKGFVGVEVPNPEPSLVSLREIMDSDEWRKIDSPLKIGLGQDVSGRAVSADLTAMPHLLVAGTTGSGKSVCVNGIISALLLTRTPDELKMIMVDPKRVELTNYNGIPHLMAPVVTDLERIVGVLKWVQREMDERYRRFAMAGARNVTDYNRRAEQKGEEKLYYIIVIVDELADLMMLAPDETERVVTRLAQMARATGIHIIISTQRPSVDVVTGLIKANFPARIAFAVPTGVDSRVILDMPGAERLLGRGDMLFQAPDAAMPLRLQGTFVSDEEIQSIVEFWRKQGAPPSAGPPPADSDDERRKAQPAPILDDKAPAVPVTAVQRPLFSTDEESSDGSSEDALFDEAVALAREMRKISISLLQRRLRIGYTRAARLIDLMEEQGIIGPHEGGSKPRKVLPVDGGKPDDDDDDTASDDD